MPPWPKLGQLRSLQPAVLITAPSANSITSAAAGTVVNASAQFTHGAILLGRPPPTRPGSPPLDVPLPNARLDCSAFISEVLPAALWAQTGCPAPARSAGRCIAIVSDISLSSEARSLLPQTPFKDPKHGQPIHSPRA